MADGYKALNEHRTELQTQLDQVTGDFDAVVERFANFEPEQISGAIALMERGFSSEELEGVGNFLEAMRTGNTSAATRMLDNARANIAIQHGETLPGVSLYQSDPELAQAVANFQMDEEIAEKIAMQRARERQGLNLGTQSPQNQLSPQPVPTPQTPQEIEAGRNAVAALEAKWRQTDPEYQLKADAILPRIDAIAKHYPPDQWATEIQGLYDTLGQMLVKSVAKNDSVKPTKTVPRPLSSAASVPGNGVPANSQEAINRVLGLSSS